MDTRAPSVSNSSARAAPRAEITPVIRALLSKNRSGVVVVLTVVGLSLLIQRIQ
jgi:hypothetical protein